MVNNPRGGNNLCGGNDIIAGVCVKLSEEFEGDDYEFYTETPRGQGNIKPCFFVTCKNPKSGAVKDRYFISKQLLGNRYLRSIGLCIEYHPAATRIKPAASPSKDKPREECVAVLDRLFACLEYIPFGDTVVRGTSMQGEVGADDVLNFFVNYDIFVYQEEEKEMMDKLTVNEISTNYRTHTLLQ